MSGWRSRFYQPITYRDFCIDILMSTAIGVTQDGDKIAFFRRDGGRTMKAVASA